MQTVVVKILEEGWLIVTACKLGVPKLGKCFFVVYCRRNVSSSCSVLAKKVYKNMVTDLSLHPNLVCVIREV